MNAPAPHRAPALPAADDCTDARYGAAVLAEAPRLLGMMDREALSPTAGCCDRTYWAWKFVDFPAARLQEALCAMAFLYTTPLPGSAYCGNPRVRDWIDLGLGFWSRLQHADGSFDEAYPFERSLAATAFTTFYVGEALEMLGSHGDRAALAAARETMARAGAWLCGNDETHGFLSNHLAAAAGALLHAHRVTGERRFERRSWYFLDRILQRQSSEGWYEEYGGADPGYQTHGSFYLARCWSLTGDERLIESLRRAARFLAHFVHPDGSVGGEYASRNTQTYYPAAYEMVAAADPVSAWIAQTLRPGAHAGGAASLRGIDVFNYCPFLNNFVMAHRACAGQGVRAPAPDPVAPGFTWFPAAGLAHHRTTVYDAYAGTAKGGVVKVFDRRNRSLAYSDCGYVGRLRNGRLVSSQYFDPARPTRAGAAHLEVDGQLTEFARPTMTPALFIGFRLFTLTVGRAARLARWLKAQLVRTLIYRRRPIAVSITRRIEFGDTEVTVRDRLSGAGAAQVRELRWGPRFTTIHMGSSRYFIDNELADPPLGDPIDPAALAAGVDIERTVRVTG